MPELRPGRELAKVTSITPAVLLSVYVGSYFAMVQPVPVDGTCYPDYGKWLSLAMWIEWDDRLQVFFTPIHRLDRRVRREFWHPGA